MLIVLVASAAVLAVLFVVHSIRLKTYKGQAEYRFRRLTMLSSMTAVLMLADAAVLYMLGMGASGGVFAVPCILMGVFGILQAGLLIAGWCCKDKPQKKALFGVQSVCSVLLLTTVVYWRLYQFWGF